MCCQTNVFAQAPRPFPPTLPTCLKDDFRELEILYESTGGSGWTIQAGWFTDANIENWHGINLTTNGCDVAAIDLDGISTFLEVGSWSTGNNLVGTIPNLSGLTELEYLSLGKNSLMGGIPTSLGSLTKLKHLCLGENQLGTTTIVGGVPTLSTIPTTLGNLPLLEVLILSQNQLTGDIPATIGTGCPNMKYLYLGNNLLTGSIPKELGNLHHLIVMYLAQNRLTGTIPSTPPWTGNCFPALTEFWAQNNLLDQPLPTDIGIPFQNLHYLLLHNNANLGNNQSIPISLGGLTNIKYIGLSNCGFGGDIPNIFQGKSGLIEIGLNKNNLTVTSSNNLSTIFSNLPSLKLLNLHENPNLSGSLAGFILPNLEQLALSHCNFSGTIPNFNLPKLDRIWLNYNNFDGIATGNFSNSPLLKQLYLSWNQLSGSMPNFNLPALEKLTLHENSFTGDLPNYNFPVIQQFSIHNNFLNFGNIKAYTDWNTRITKYSQQKTVLPLTLNGSVLTADLAGEATANNLTYTWYHNGTPIGTPISGSHQYTITVSGNYSYSVTNIPGVTIASNTDKNLILPSATVTFATPLPLELLRFDATKKENDVLLNWQTTNEQNTSHFNIQRSTDGTRFSNIGKVTSNNKTTLNDYRFEDKNLPNGTLYYRLEQVDRDEKTTFSPVRSVEKSDKFYYNLSPNPTQDMLTINGNADYDLDMTIEIYNAIGSCVYKQETAVNKGAFEEKTDMTNFAEGTYIVLLRLSNGFSLQKTIIKIK